MHVRRLHSHPVEEEEEEEEGDGLGSEGLVWNSEEVRSGVGGVKEVEEV